MHILKRTLAITAALLLGAVGLAGTASMLNGNTIRLYSVQSGSMEPALSRGDLMVVQRVPASDYQIGDVITFMNPQDRSQTITHRIVEIAEGTRRVFRTQGDANPGADQPFNETLVVGRQIAAVPYVGRGLDAIRTWPGLVAVVYLPALFIIVGETRRLSNHYKHQQAYRYKNQINVFRWNN